MSRIRSIHPGIWTDEAFVTLSAYARVFLIGLWTESDDKGIFPWSPLKLKMRVLPADNVDVGELLAELVDGGLVMRYEIEGKPFAAIRNFARFQRPKKPNDIYPATEPALRFAGHDTETKGDESGKVPASPETGSPPVPHQSEKLPADEGGRMEDGGEKELEPEGSCASDDAPALKPEHIFEKWNQLADRIGKPKVRDLTPERRALLKCRIAQYPIEDFVSVFDAIERSGFLRGDTGWRGCSFNWVFKRGNFQKILEGNYND